MPQLTFPIVADELRVDVRVNRSAPDLIAISAAGQPAPAAISARAQIDTGSNVTGLSPAILLQLGSPPLAHSSTQGVGGGVSVRLFRVSISILDAANSHLPWFVQPDLLVMELPPGFPVDVLIGMDVLLGCRMLVDGPARSFTLDF